MVDILSDATMFGRFMKTLDATKKLGIPLGYVVKNEDDTEAWNTFITGLRSTYREAGLSATALKRRVEQRVREGGPLDPMAPRGSKYRAMQPVGVYNLTRTCAFCATVSLKKLRKCSGCRCVRYCNESCAKSHWRAGHKSECSLK